MKKVWWKFYSEQEKESGISGMFFVILLASFAMVLINYSRPLVQKKVMISGELRNDLDTYRRMISMGLSCPMSLPVYPRLNCKENTPVDIRSSNGNIIIASNGGAGSRFGKWYLRARCVEQPVRKIVIEASLRSKKGELIKSPLNGTKVDWTDVFSSKIYAVEKNIDKNLCEGYFKLDSTHKDNAEIKYEKAHLSTFQLMMGKGY